MSACAWDVYVKDGIVWREGSPTLTTKVAAARRTLPRGCQRGVLAA